VTNAFPTLPLLRERWFVKCDHDSGLLESVLIHLTQVKASLPSDLVSTLVHWDRTHQHCVSAVSTLWLRFKTPPFLLPFLGCSGEYDVKRCLGRLKGTAPLLPTYPVNARLILLAQPLHYPNSPSPASRCTCRCISVMVLCTARHLLPSIPDVLLKQIW